MTVKEDADLRGEWFRTGMRIRLSSLYHLERRRFFEDWNRVTQFLSVVLGSGACVALVNETSKGAAIWLTFAVTVLSAANLVVGFGRRSWDHARLHDQFVDLESEQRRAECTKGSLNDITERKRNLDKAEPAPMPYLVTRCQIDLMRADGYESNEWPKLHWFKRMAANYLPDLGHESCGRAVQPRQSDE